MRTGDEYLRSLNDGRRVFVDGELIKDVTTHPAFRQAARSIATLYDIAAQPDLRERMTFTSPKTGAPVHRAWQIPKDHAGLRARRLFSETWAEATFGLMGRAPDHVAGFFSGYAANPKFFASAGQQQFADNLVAFYEFMRDNYIYCSYAIVPPQIDRSKPAHKQSDPTLYAGVVKERDDGIVISGAQQLATGGAISDELHPAARARRRELRQLSRRADLGGGFEALSPASLCRRWPRRRLSTVEPVRRIRQLRHFR